MRNAKATGDSFVAVGGISIGSQVHGDFSALAVLKHTGWVGGKPKFDLFHLERGQMYDPRDVMLRMETITRAVSDAGALAFHVAVESTPVTQPFAYDLVGSHNCCRRGWDPYVFDTNHSSDPVIMVTPQIETFAGMQCSLFDAFVTMDAAIRSGALRIPDTLRHGKNLYSEAQQLRTKINNAGKGTVLTPEAMQGEFTDLITAVAIAYKMAETYTCRDPRTADIWGHLYTKHETRGPLQKGQPEPGSYYYSPYDPSWPYGVDDSWNDLPNLRRPVHPGDSSSYHPYPTTDVLAEVISKMPPRYIQHILPKLAPQHRRAIQPQRVH